MKETIAPALYTQGDYETCYTALQDFVKENPSVVLFNRPRGFEWEEVTATQFLAEVRSVAKGLIAHGIEYGDRVALMSENRYEWPLVDFAIWAAGAVTVPIYSSSSTAQVEWILLDSGAKIGIADGESSTTRMHYLLHSPAPKGGLTSQLQHVFTMNTGGITDLISTGKTVSDAELDARSARVKNSDLGSLVYTSGTTGKPKGCELAHSNWLGEARAILTNPITVEVKPGAKLITFLPLAHVFSRAIAIAATLGGATQTHWADFGTLTLEFQRTKPDLIVSVPRIFEKIHAATKAKAQGGISERIFSRAEKTAIEYSRALDTPEGPNTFLKAQHKLYDRLVFKKIREAMGGEIKYCISGGSALNPELIHFFRGAGIIVFEGYGLTESTAAVAVNQVAQNKIGTVGTCFGGNSIRIAPDGEILLKGDVVFKGYWNNPEATQDAFDEDGYFSTGDLGALDAEGYLRITGRKKEILVTAGGKNVSPGPLEDTLRGHPLISQAMLIGNNRPFISALITLDAEALDKWKANNNISGSPSMADLATLPGIRSEIQDAINEANKSVSRAEGIKKFRIVTRDFTEEEGEMTPSLKIRRHIIGQHFADDIAWIYESQHSE